MSLVTISEDAKALLRARMDASGIARPVVWIAMAEPVGGGRRFAAGEEDDDDWTHKRKELWVLQVAPDEGIGEKDARLAVAEGIRFVSDFFPIRFEITLKDGRLRVAAAA